MAVPGRPTGGNSAKLAEVERKVSRYYEEVLSPPAGHYLFELPRTHFDSTLPPTVLVLGNHSSGKSTFINYLLGHELQRTGLAPVDDGFTIITHAEEEDELDGPALISHPSYPYRSLERFGPTLVSRLKMKSIPIEQLKKVTVIDSPGMIDSADSHTDRGYDFPAVVKFFAESADVILLFFDPDKPGTTGETMSILRESLSGMDHKLLIVMNKVDRFENMRDFARAYGALCWNLARAISSKDLPHIYNMYIPGQDSERDSTIPLQDFDTAREEVLHELSRAPRRRMENTVSELYGAARRLNLHVRACLTTARDLVKARVAYYSVMGLTVFLTLIFAYAIAGLNAGDEELSFFQKIKAPLYTIIGGGILTGFIYGVSRFDRKWRERSALAGIDEVFRRLYSKELALGTRRAELEALWGKVKDGVIVSLKTLGPSSFKLAFPFGCGLSRLKRAAEEDIPRLRSETSSKTGA